MKVRTDYASHFRQVEVGGDTGDSGNGVLLTAGASGLGSTIDAVGDDTNVALILRAKVAGASVQRFVGNGAAKTIVDGSATALFDVACAAGEMSGGTIHFLVRASDGTDHQALSGIATYACVNKAATLTLTVTYVAANEAKAVSSGTLTLAWTFVTGTGKGTIKLQPTGSLTETTYTVEYNVYPIRGAVTIL